MNTNPREDSGEFTLVAVCNEKEEIGWFNSEELTVKNIDEVCPKDILSGI